MDCRLKYAEDIREDVFKQYSLENTSAQLIKPNVILLPIGSEKLKTLNNTNGWAKRVAKILNEKYLSKFYGNVVEVDNKKDPRGTLINITIKTKLIDAFERKHGTQTQMFSLDNNKVNYQLKIIKALESDKVRQPKTSIIQGFYNDLIKQGVTNQQLDLVKDIYKDGMTKDELIANLLGSISYTVEINTAKGGSKLLETEFNAAAPEWMHEDYLDRERTPGENNTSFNSNLTVPGGTNYTENEISTPAITPSIKGHAQFATDNGIGWFRSDESQTKDDLQRELHTQDFTFEQLLQIGEIKQVPCG